MGSTDRPGGAALLKKERSGLAPTMGHLRQDSPRWEDWRCVFGTRSVPLKSPLPVENEGPDGREKFYLVDVAQLDVAQVDRLIDHVSKKFGLTPEEVRADLAGEHGLPIRAADISVSFDARLVI